MNNKPRKTSVAVPVMWCAFRRRKSWMFEKYSCFLTIFAKNFSWNSQLTTWISRLYRTRNPLWRSTESIVDDRRAHFADLWSRRKSSTKEWSARFSNIRWLRLARAFLTLIMARSLFFVLCWAALSMDFFCAERLTVLAISDEALRQCPVIALVEPP